MTKTLDKLRAEIDAVDAELVEALNKRTRLVAEVAAAKSPGSAIFRPGREADLKTRLKQMAPYDQKKLIEPVWRPLLRASIASQKPDFTITFPPEAQTQAAIFAADFLTLSPAPSLAAGIDMVVSGAADILFASVDDLPDFASHLGEASGLYIVAKEKDWFLIALGKPDPSAADKTVFEIKSDSGVEFLERDGYFDAVPDNMGGSRIVGIYQCEPDHTT